jgi:hypothetical protein
VQSQSTRALTALAAVVSLAAGLCGCGVANSRGGSGVILTLTRGFGATPVAAIAEPALPRSETVIRVLERSFQVAAQPRGGPVQSIDGQPATASQLRWSYYINGIEATVGADKTAVHAGDRIWWDLHGGNAVASVPAVVGSFPEPFVHGSGGKRLPTTIECGTDVSAACARVAAELSSIGVKVATGLLGGSGSGTDSLGVVVGTWHDLQGAIVASLIANGPSSSGVYARFAGAGGSLLQLLDPEGQVARTLEGDAGLIAATAQSSSEPTWVITGTDPAGVLAAAAALAPGPLRDHFALAVQGTSELPLPLQGSVS